jgi:TonB family protein
VEFFQQAAARNPKSLKAHLYLGSSLMSMWIPSNGVDANELSAEKEFRRVLELDAKNDVALAGLANIVYAEAGGLSGEERNRKLDEAAGYYSRLAAVDPSNKVAPYSIGVIAWQKWYRALMTERAKLRMKPEDPGPLPEPARGELKAKYSSIIEDGIASLDRALVLDPHYDDAMAYMSLLIRERADLWDTKEEYAADVAVADQWAQKNLDIQKTQAGIAELTPIQAGSVLAGANVVRKVEPVYPPLAKEARIQGIVRFTITIGKDGTVRKIQLVSGHPLLVEAALDALKQWVYKPTILNGEPVEVISQVDIQFTLTQ